MSEVWLVSHRFCPLCQSTRPRPRSVLVRRHLVCLQQILRREGKGVIMSWLEDARRAAIGVEGGDSDDSVVIVVESDDSDAERVQEDVGVKNSGKNKMENNNTDYRRISKKENVNKVKMTTDKEKSKKMVAETKPSLISNHPNSEVRPNVAKQSKKSNSSRSSQKEPSGAAALSRKVERNGKTKLSHGKRKKQPSSKTVKSSHSRKDEITGVDHSNAVKEVNCNGDFLVRKKGYPENVMLTKEELTESVEIEAKGVPQHLTTEEEVTDAKKAYKEENFKSEDINISNTDVVKHSLHDRNFVVAKFTVKRKLGFFPLRVLNESDLEMKIRKLVEQADITKIRAALDSCGGQPDSEISRDVRNEVKKENNVRQKPGRVQQEQGRLQQLLRLQQLPGSCDISYQKSSELVKPMPEDQVPQMPIVNVSPESKRSGELAGRKRAQGRRPQAASVVGREKKTKTTAPRPIQPKVAPVVFPSANLSRSFKIPRTPKVKQPSWVVAGKMWQTALSLDQTGQWFVTKLERKLVPGAAKVPPRPHLPPEIWLVRGRRVDRVEFEQQGEKGGKSEGRGQCRDPLGLDTHFPEYSRTGHNSPPETKGGSDSTPQQASLVQYEEKLAKDDHGPEESILEDNLLDISGQSLVTHIQSPTHVFCLQVEEEELEQEEIGEAAVPVGGKEKSEEIKIERSRIGQSQNSSDSCLFTSASPAVNHPPETPPTPPSSKRSATSILQTTSTNFDLNINPGFLGTSASATVFSSKTASSLTQTVAPVPYGASTITVPTLLTQTNNFATTATSIPPREVNVENSGWLSDLMLSRRVRFQL